MHSAIRNQRAIECLINPKTQGHPGDMIILLMIRNLEMLHEMLMIVYGAQNMMEVECLILRVGQRLFECQVVVDIVEMALST